MAEGTTAQPGNGAGTADTAKEQARELAGQAQEKAQAAAGEARGRLTEQVDQRTTQAGDQLRSTTQDVRSVADELRKQGKDAPARYAEQAAERGDRIAQYLSDADADRIVRDVEDFGRRNPLAVVAGGIALGFAASRLLKASSRDRYESSSRELTTTTGTSPYAPAPSGPAPGAGTPATPATPPEGTQATRPASWQGGLGGEGEGAHRV